jgi:hypothetical protein
MFSLLFWSSHGIVTLKSHSLHLRKRVRTSTIRESICYAPTQRPQAKMTVPLGILEGRDRGSAQSAKELVSRAWPAPWLPLLTGRANPSRRVVPKRSHGEKLSGRNRCYGLP